MDSDTIVWALRGSWRKQHDAKMLPNGHILMFDNEGGLVHGRSRALGNRSQHCGRRLVLRWDRKRAAQQCRQSGWRAAAAERQYPHQRFNAGRLLEVSPDGSIVWEYVNPVQSEERGKKIIASFGLTATRYEPSYVSFLDRKQSPQAVR